MSPTSYQTAPPRVAGSTVARRRHVQSGPIGWSEARNSHPTSALGRGGGGGGGRRSGALGLGVAGLAEEVADLVDLGLVAGQIAVLQRGLGGVVGRLGLVEQRLDRRVVHTGG